MTASSHTDFPLPWTVILVGDSFCVVDANKFPVCYVPFSDKRVTREISKRPSREEGGLLASRITQLALQAGAPIAPPPSEPDQFTPDLKFDDVLVRIAQPGPDLDGIGSEHLDTLHDSFPLWRRYQSGKPLQHLWAIWRRSDGPGYVNDLLRWGLLPTWARSLADWHSPLSLPAEELRIKASFRKAYRSRRCLIPVTPYFEICAARRDGIVSAPTRRRYAIGMKDRSPFAVAGIWEMSKDSVTGSKTYTFSIITCQANDLVSSLSDRMPVILGRGGYSRWLDYVDADPADLMVPYPADLMSLELL